MEKKICKKCLVEKDICEFYKNSQSKDGVRSKCKKCVLVYFKKEMSVDAKLRKKERSRTYREKNKDIIKVKIKNYYSNNPDKLKNIKIYRQEHRKNNLEYYRNYYNNRIKNDLNFKLMKNLRIRLNKIIKNKNFTKNNSIANILGCSLLEFKSYVELKFIDGMSWDNYGYYGWHLDHIIPLSSAKTKKEIYKLCHFNNLQPLWWTDNLSKGKKQFELTCFYKNTLNNNF